MKKSSIQAFLLLAFIPAVFDACKKDKKDVTPVVTLPSPTATRDDLTKDSVFLYAKEVYLWNDALPTYEVFNPRGFKTNSANIDNLDAELFAITRYKINPATGKPYEYNNAYPTETKYSFIEDLVASGKITYAASLESSVGLDGQGNGFGIGGLSAVGTNDSYKIYLKYASPGSPAALAGLGRGDYIDKVNGTSIGTNFSSEVDLINSAFNENTATSLSLEGQKKNGNRFSVTLSKTKYTSSPIYKDTILTVGTKKVGYLAYARFSDTNNSEAALTNVFSKFSAGGVTDLVIDLRYNGGGFVSTAEHLVDLIAPSSTNGKVMFAEAFNSTLQNGGATILRNQPLRDQSGKIQYSNGRIVTYADLSYTIADNTTNIEKKGALDNVGKVVFITTGGTASASELVINSLKPYVDVKTVGSTSYGKPVGFFPIRIDKYDVYLSMFSSTNSSGQGDYYAGFTPDAQKTDDVTRDFGNTSEICLSAALSYINTGVFTSSTSTQTMSVNGVSRAASSITVKDAYAAPSFQGMIYTPKKLK